MPALIDPSVLPFMTFLASIVALASILLYILFKEVEEESAEIE